MELGSTGLGISATGRRRGCQVGICVSAPGEAKQVRAGEATGVFLLRKKSMRSCVTLL